MRHVFRKYTSNRGSALFMVISTMTALLVSVMAMYFAMVSSRQTQYAVFNKMQASQSAQSIADVVYNSIADPSNHAAGGGVLLQQMKDLGVGESISTGANGFASLDPGIETGLDESQLGAYSVTITRLPNYPNGDMRFDILVMSSVDGNRDAVHLELGHNEKTEYTPGEGEDGSGGDAELFAATGYVPNDAYINGGYYLTNVFYDTQYTYMGTFDSSGNNRIGQNLSTGGDLMLSGNAMTVVHDGGSESISSQDVNKIGPVTWAIRGNFYPNVGNDFAVRGGSQILVGGDLTFDSGNNFFVVKNDGYYQPSALGNHVCVYINGDFNYSPGAELKNNMWIFVNGKVTGFSGNPIPSNSRIYVTGDSAQRAEKTASLQPNVKNAIKEWPKNGTFADGMTYDEAMAMLGQRTQTIAYYKWDLSKNTENSPLIDIRVNASDNEWTDDKGDTYGANEGTFIIAYDKTVESAQYIKSEGGNENGVIGKSFVINSVLTNEGSNNMGPTILIDTGDDPENIMTLKLGDVTGKGEFSWFVDKDGNVPTYALNNVMRLVLIKGRGTVLLDLPKGVTYQNSAFTLTSNIGWWLIQGGKIQKQNIGGKEHLVFNGRQPRKKTSKDIVPYIHKTCEKDDGCVFSKSESTSTCKHCNGTLTQVTCSVHGDVNVYCSTCHPEKASRTDWCANHVDKLAFDTFYNGLTDMNKDWVTGSDGKPMYPNTNLMIVSCDESVDMRFARTANGTGLEDSAFFGFIYAPYMSYMAQGDNNGGGYVRLCGGLTVGDYDLAGFESYIGCYPDKMPNEIAGMAGGGSMAGGKLGGTTKSWKIEIGGYT